MATGSIGSPSISIATATPIPQNTSPQGREPPITPSTTSFIREACGAGSSVELYPHALLRRYIIPPIARPDITAPINSPVCWYIGVAPTI